MRAISYQRCSTREQEDSGLGLEGQRIAIEGAINYRLWNHVADHHDVSSGRSTERRPGLQSALIALSRGDANVLVVSRLDRLSRSVADFAKLLERAGNEGWALKVLDLDIDTTTANGELVANVLMALAQWERRIAGERTKAALQVKKEQGARLGRPLRLSEATRARIRHLYDEGGSLIAVATQLNEEGVPTAHGGRAWYASTVRAVLRS